MSDDLPITQNITTTYPKQADVRNDGGTSCCSEAKRPQRRGCNRTSSALKTSLTQHPIGPLRSCSAGLPQACRHAELAESRKSLGEAGCGGQIFGEIAAQGGGGLKGETAH
jgi:hypothetical protein